MIKEKHLHLSAKIISTIFSPFYVPIVGFLALFLFTYLNRMLPLSYQLLILGAIYSFTVLIPMISIYVYQRINGLSLQHLKVKENRLIPYIMTLLSYTACLILLIRMGTPRFFSGIIISSLIVLTLCAIINTWWKISAHMAAIGQFIGGLIAFSLLFAYNPINWLCLFILLAGLIGTSRMILHQHSLAQVLIGFAIGLASGLTGILLF